MSKNNLSFLGAGVLFFGAMSQSFAQSSVRIYGVLDGGIVYTNTGKNTLKQASGTGSTSRLGFTGYEDLGGGWRAAFQLESSFQADVGAIGSTTRQGTNAFFNRESNISISNPDFGTIKLGRQLPAQLSLALDPFLAVSGFSPFASLLSSNSDLGAGATIGDSRISNSISYYTPDREGLGGQLLYGFRENTAAGYTKASDYGLEMHYRKGALSYLGAQFAVINVDPSGGASAFKNYWIAAGAQYLIGPNALSYQINLVSPQRDGYLKAQTHVLGWTYTPNSRHVVKASLVYRNVPARKTNNAISLGLGYEYNFSKNTALYTRLGLVGNHSTAISSLAGASPDVPGNDVKVIAAGIRMRF